MTQKTKDSILVVLRNIVLALVGALGLFTAGYQVMRPALEESLGDKFVTKEQMQNEFKLLRQEMQYEIRHLGDVVSREISKNVIRDLRANRRRDN